MRTFLELMQAFADEVGLPQPSQVIGAADDTSRQFLALANREGREFSSMAHSRGGWQNLHKEYRFLTECLEGETGGITAGSGVITGLSDTSSIVAGEWLVSADGFSNLCNVVSVDSSTQITVDLKATKTDTVSIDIGKAAYALPSDFAYFANRTFWDNSYRWELIGAIDAQEKQILRYGVTAPVIRRTFYIRNNKMWLVPTPSENGELIAYDYYSNAFCASSGGTWQTKWTADTDTYLLDEDSFILGMKYRYLRAKGFDFANEYREYMQSAGQAMARDSGSRVLSLSDNTYFNRFIDYDNIPETGYGV